MRNKYWLRRTSFKRNTGSKGKPVKRFLIVCEGTKTEPAYFESFKVSTVNVDIEGTGMNTKSLVEYAVRKKSEAKDLNEDYDEVWCVFDKDDFAISKVEAAFKLAKDNDIKLAYSNECFELWYLLHFNYLSTAITRDAYYKSLKKLLGRSYEKNDRKLYLELLDKQTDAIRNAKKLHDFYSKSGTDLIRRNPYTMVYNLVIELNKYVD